MYTDVEKTPGIHTDQFLKATDHMLNMFGTLKRDIKKELNGY